MPDDLIPIQTALISVTDKRGIQEFVRQLKAIQPSVAVLSSGGTAKILSEAGIPVTEISEYTQFPECFDGRVKTLHPMVEGGILFHREKHKAEAGELGVRAIDLIVCNLYDFDSAAQDERIPMEELVEKMDIGGPTLIRSACKNYTQVAVAVDPKDYPVLIEELKRNHGKLSLKTRERLAATAINLSADYEALIAHEFSKRLLRQQVHRPKFINGRALRYGENPDQRAEVYAISGQHGIAQAEILSGKELSFNNYEDATVAYNAAQELLELGAQHGFSIIKHGSLCGFATGETLLEAFEYAWEGDAKSAFGSVIGSVSEVTEELIPSLDEKFIEVLAAPSFSLPFVDWAKERKPNLRLLKVPSKHKSPCHYKHVSGGILMQSVKERVSHSLTDQIFHQGCVTQLKVENNKRALYIFGVAAVSHAKSNAVALVREYRSGQYQTLSIGAGQPNRIDSLERLAIPKAVENILKEHPEEGYDPKAILSQCVLASDGFFPFDDSIRFAAKWGIAACIQPGGSKNDQRVIDAANELGICMVLTGERYFSH